MKIVAVLGSPRLNGNSATLAKRFLETAEALGAETQTFALNKLNYRGCQGCMSCKKKSEVCVLQDDLTEVIEAVRGTDVLLLATPVYYSDVTGQMKLFIDRMFCFLTPDFHNNPQRTRLAPGKKLVFIQTQGQAEETSFADVFPRYQVMMHFNGIEEAHLIRGCGLGRLNDARRSEDLLKQAEELAAKIVTGGAARR